MIRRSNRNPYPPLSRRDFWIIIALSLIGAAVWTAALAWGLQHVFDHVFAVWA